MQCAHPFNVRVKGRLFYDPLTGGHRDSIAVPCGKCMPCRIRRRSEWTTRLYMEADRYESKCFATLTYADHHLNAARSLNPRDITLFHKRLRRAAGVKIRYYMCGEYGDTTDRPHYHGIYFGLGPDQTALFSECWPYGMVKLGTVTHDSIQYVCGYIQKKLYDDMADEAYHKVGRVPPFARMSKGIGLDWALQYRDYIMSKHGVTIDGKHVGLPRYWRDKLLIDYDFNPREHDKRLMVSHDFSRADLSVRKEMSALAHELNVNAIVGLKAEKKKTII